MKFNSQRTGVLALILALTLTTDAFKLFHKKHREPKRGKTIADDMKESEEKFVSQNKEYASIIDITSAVPEVRTAGLFETVELNCDATSSPTPTIHWLLNGSRMIRKGEGLTDDEAYYENTPRNQKRPLSNKGSTTSKLVLNCVTPKDEGLYSCVAQTPKGRIVKSTRLVIGNEITSDNNKCQVEQQGESPIIYMNTELRFERNDADVQLFCRASGYPKPQMVWTKDDKVLNGHHKKYKVLPNGDLLVKSTRWPDMGQYRCTAKNELGEDSADVFFYPFA